jgi:hypothetical protein
MFGGHQRRRGRRIREATTHSLRYWKTPTFKTLKTIEAACARARNAKCKSQSLNSWVLTCRTMLRRIYAGFNPLYNACEVPVLRSYMAKCPPEMLPICIWLLGKCADRFRLYGLHEYRHHESPRVRGEVAKALRRVEAWALLREMAAAYPEDRKVHWFATAPIAHRPFSQRLARFKKSVDDSHAGEVMTPSRMPYWASQQSWAYTPPKSVEIIRRVLRRIRHWVRWGTN